MFGFDVFAEIMVIGGLLLLALAPLLARLLPWSRRDSGFLPTIVIDYLKQGSGRFVVALLVTYALGVAGNRLVDDALDMGCVEPANRHWLFQGALDLACVDPGSIYKAEYKTWVASTSGRPPSLKSAEFWLRERNEATAEWLDRHKSFVRILRGAAAASALLLLTMGIYRFSRPPAPRYHRVHFVGVSILLIIFAVAYYLEAKGYQERVFKLSKELPLKSGTI